MATNNLLNLPHKSPMMTTPWQIELLGWLRAIREERVVSRFRTQKTGLLLAHLAYYQHRSHPREVLIELLWPEMVPALGRQSLRKALSSLRQQLEPPDTPAGAVLLADQATVQLNPTAVTTDVAEFEAALHAAGRADGSSTQERVRRLSEAADLFRGELLPGYYAEWIMPERQRLAEAHLQALRQLVALLQEAGDLSGAAQWARRAVAAGPLSEEAHADLIQLLAAAGQPEAALRQYRELERLLVEQLGAPPSPEVQDLARTVYRQAGRTRKPRQDNHIKPLATSAASTREATGAPSIPCPTGKATASADPQGPAAGEPPAGRLPLQFTRFFGREAEIERLCALLLRDEERGTKNEREVTGDRAAGSRDERAASVAHPSFLVPRSSSLLTLTGPGGSGKTRLAIETARQLLEPFQQTVWFVPLLDLSDPALIIDRILETLRLPQSPRMEPLDQVADFLSRRPALLLLDNFEHLVTDGAATLQRLRERVETLTLLVTSRQALGLPGEREIPVGPLPVPGGQTFRRSGVQDRTAEDLNTRTPEHLNTLAACPSIQLFVDRAQAVRADFQVTAANAAAVAGLCRQLEGLPLALELAAARASVLTPQQMLARLSQRFDLLESRQRSPDPRHRSLRATLDWSYRLLSPALQRFFAQLSIFRGGWTLEAAEAVCEQPGGFDCLTQLRVSSLVQIEECSGEMRCRLLETLREFGREHLDEAGWLTTTRRHAAFYLSFVERAEAEFAGPAQQEWVARLEAEHDNIRAVLERCQTAAGDVELGLRLGGALWWFWHWRDHRVEGRARLEQLLALPEAQSQTAVRAKALACAGLLAVWEGDMRAARALSQESLRIGKELGDPVSTAMSLRNLGEVALRGDRDLEAARALDQECLAAWRALGNRWGVAMSLDLLADVARAAGGYAAARGLEEQELAIRREFGDRQGIAACLCDLGVSLWKQGDLAEARSLVEKSSAIRRELGHKLATTMSLTCLGLLLCDQCDYRLAQTKLEECLTIERELGNPCRISLTLTRLGKVAQAQGDDTAARAFLEESRAVRQRMGTE